MTVSRWPMLILILVFSLMAGSIGCGEQAVTGPATTSRAPSQPTVISAVTGEVLVLKAGATTWNEASPGIALEPGDRIKTGAGSNAIVTFFEGSTIELAADTEISVSELGIVGPTDSTVIKLWQQVGKTRNRVEKLVDPASRYEIETPAGAAVVRGSVGDVEVDRDGITRITNIEGRWCGIGQGKEVCMSQGYYITIIPKHVPSTPVPVPPPPVLPLPPVTSQQTSSARHPSPHVSLILRPAIGLTKTANKTQAHDGDTITYTYQVTNPGDTPLFNVTVTDDKGGATTYQSGDTNGNNRLDIDETWVFAASYTVSAQDNSPLVNIATASGTDALSHIVTAQSSASADILRPAIALTKTANRTQAYVGDNITYTYQVTNPGNTPLSDVVVTDDKAGTPTYQSGDTDGDNKLDIDETWVFTAIYTVSGQGQSPLVNIATASGSDALSRVVTAQDSASVDISNWE